MRRYLTLCAGVALTIAATPPQAVSAQLTIGTTPGAPTVLIRDPLDSQYHTQSFRAAGRFLTSVSFWFYGGVRERPFTFSTYFSVMGGPTGRRQNETTVVLDQSSQGRYTIQYDYLPMVVDATYYFLYTNAYCGENPLPWCIVGDEDQIAPGFEYTTLNAYADGGYGIDYSSGPDQDLRFEATFANAVPVPEPSTSLLMLTGLFGLGFVGRRRRRTLA